jgi:hypothetical protein
MRKGTGSILRRGRRDIVGRIRRYMREMGGVGEGEGRGRLRRLESRYPVGSQIEAWKWEWLMAVFISLVLQEVMIHKETPIVHYQHRPIPYY